MKKRPYDERRGQAPRQETGQMRTGMDGKTQGTPRGLPRGEAEGYGFGATSAAGGGTAGEAVKPTHGQSTTAMPGAGAPGGLAQGPGMIPGDLTTPGAGAAGAAGAAGEAVKPAIGAEELLDFTRILQMYKAGKARTEQRILASEQWWKLRNSTEEQKVSQIGKDGGFRSVSGWLHNVIVAKHADAMESYPEPNILPREQGDRAEARMLSAIIPCVLEQNHFERTYSDAMWQKLKTGTGCYKVIWDKDKLGGLGDIAVERVNLLNIYWEPGVTDIQKSRYFFHTELVDKDILQERHPELQGKLDGGTFLSTKFLYDDAVDTTDKATVIDVYYRKWAGDRAVLHYCKYVGDHVLFATENRPDMAAAGLYDHGKFPYVFDALYPIEGSPCGYGFVDICRNPQTEIDLMKTAFVKNAMAGATPRYFSRVDGNVNEAELLDLSKAVVHVNGNVDEASLRVIDHCSLDGNYLTALQYTIQELRETSGNTETSTGSTSAGVTAASAIAALQEASGKGSRDSTQAAYRAYAEIVDLCIELIRQFYDLPRKFRIVGQYGAEQFVSYTNQGLRQQAQGTAFGQDMGYRQPVFDIKVSAQKRSVYTKVTQNELALQFFNAGFFNPQLVDQTLLCLDMMEFDGRDELMQKLSRYGDVYQTLQLVEQYALNLAAKYGDQMALSQLNGIISRTGGKMPAVQGAQPEGKPEIAESDELGGMKKKEHALVEKSRQRSQQASQPG